MASTTQHPASAAGAGPGFLATAILALAYLTFTALAAFAPALLAAPLHAGSAVTLAFALGLGVIGLGFALTVAYALAANRREKQATTGASLATEGAAR